MPGPLRLKLKGDQFLDSTTFVIPTNHPPKFIFFSITVFCFIVLFPSKISKLLLVCIGLFFAYYTVQFYVQVKNMSEQ